MWNRYLEITGGRPHTNALTYSEILAWSQLTGTDVEPWEVDTFRRLDAICAEVLTNARPG